MKKLIILLFLLFSSNFMYPFFFHFDVWTDGTRNYFFLSDWHEIHNKNQEVCNIQRYDLIKWAKILNASLVVEDIYYNYYSNGFYGLTAFVPLILSKSASPLIWLTALCKNAGIPVCNVEFRACFEQMPFSSAFEIVNEIITQIEDCNDSETLCNIYASTLENYNKLQAKYKEAIGFLKTCPLSIDEIQKIVRSTATKDDIDLQLFEGHAAKLKACEKILSNPEVSHFTWELRNLFLYDLIDVRILQSIHNQQNTNVIIAAGDHHTKNVKNKLKALGYTPIYSSGDVKYAITKTKFFLEHLEEEVDPIDSLVHPLNLDSAFSQIAKWKLQVEEPLLVTNPHALAFKLKSYIDNSYLCDVFNVTIEQYRAFQYMALGALAISAGAAVCYSLA